MVGTPRSIRANIRHDEMMHMVPNLIVHEPIAWNDIPIVIERARLELLRWLDTRPNLTARQHQTIIMYRLRSLELNQGSLDPYGIVET